MNRMRRGQLSEKSRNVSGVGGTNVRVLHVIGSFVPPAAALPGVGGDLESPRQEVVSRYQLLLESAA